MSQQWHLSTCYWFSYNKLNTCTFLYELHELVDYDSYIFKEKCYTDVLPLFYATKKAVHISVNRTINPYTVKILA